MKKVNAADLQGVVMVAGNEKRISKVIDCGELKEWVGFGWITLRKATQKDRSKYPIVVRPA